MEQRILELIEQYADRITEIGRTIWENPELGYKEVKTARLFADCARALGLRVEENLAITGVKAYLGEPDPSKPTLAVIGELDALPHEDENGMPCARHKCGHNAQMAGLIGAMLVLTDETVRAGLDGNLVFMAVPAEEYVEVDFKKGLMKQGLIEFGGGKTELIRTGAFDDIDLALGHHTDPKIKYAVCNVTSNGFVNKIVTFHGRSSHAAGAPENGRDALKAAVLAMQAIDQHTEFYRDEDHVRVHGFITEGGLAANIIADRAVLEYSVRAGNIPALRLVNERVDRCLKAAAYAHFCDVEIETMSGYLPTVPVKDPSVVADAIRDLGAEPVIYPAEMHMSGSTDYGELSTIMPVLQVYTGGYEGALHNKDIRVSDERVAYVDTAAILALTAWKLLGEGRARKILEENPPRMTKDEVVAVLRSLDSDETYRYSGEEL